MRERGSLTLEQAVRSVTSAVAGAYRIADRGALVPGALVNGVRTVDERGVLRECGRPGQLLRDFGP